MTPIEGFILPSDIEAVADFVKAIARCNESFAELARWLRLQPSVKVVIQWLEIPTYDSFDGYWNPTLYRRGNG